MILGWILLILFLVGYFAFASTIIWHLKVYAFSRSAKWMIKFFITLAITLSVLSLVFFWAVNWEQVTSFYSNA